ncbi:MAG: hypothetical protein ABJP79_10160 [Tateyamaria sp.]|uniref:hypothetical protein n=1 Tax=Tateyamaria sp. TaxID=1929288 RepID=UPI00329C962E
MPLEFCIIPQRGLVLLEYDGFSTIDELRDATVAYLAHPDYAAGQKQLVDLTNVVGFEKDYVRFMELQAAKTERLEGAGVQSLVVYIAPTAMAQQVATLFTRTWAPTRNVIAMVQNTEAQALELLGQPEHSIDALLAATGKARKRPAANEGRETRCPPD